MDELAHIIKTEVLGLELHIKETGVMGLWFQGTLVSCFMTQAIPQKKC